MPQVSLTQIRHPLYRLDVSNWQKYRDAAEGGTDFRDNYLTMFSAREDTTDFATRKSMSYTPAHAKKAMIRIKNSIIEKLADVSRIGGPASYEKAVAGENGGVDQLGSTMNEYMASKPIWELLVIGRVGIYIDKGRIDSTAPRNQTRGVSPYLYTYQAEDILSWAYDTDHKLSAVLLRDYTDVTDPVSGLVTSEAVTYRRLMRMENGVEIAIFADDGVTMIESLILDLQQIPFVIMSLNQSLMTDIADYQIALLNLASSDMTLATTNFPFYVEQADELSMLSAMTKGGTTADGDTAATNENNSVEIGAAKGRRYAKGTERPGFINPSSEPLKASLLKQEKLEQDITELVNIALESAKSSASGADIVGVGPAIGLAHIGYELQHGEREIGKIWAEYESSEDVPDVKYPRRYNIQSDEERRNEAKDLLEIIPTIPSTTFQKVLARRVSALTAEPYASDAEIREIHSQIDEATVVVIDPNVIEKDHENGFVSTETASQARGYPKGEVEQAKKDHAERAARIAMAQSAATYSADANPAARGVDDLAVSPTAEAKKEKTQSQDVDMADDTSKPVRGDGK